MPRGVTVLTSGSTWTRFYLCRQAKSSDSPYRPSPSNPLARDHRTVEPGNTTRRTVYDWFSNGHEQVPKRHFRDVCTHPMDPDVTVLSSRRKGFSRGVNRNGVDGPAAIIKYD
jgi:hypothetical protein